jgi:hypothetical protein
MSVRSLGLSWRFEEIEPYERKMEDEESVGSGRVLEPLLIVGPFPLPSVGGCRGTQVGSCVWCNEPTEGKERLDSQPLTPVPSAANLPFTKLDFHRHAYKSSNTDPARVTHCSGAEAELPVFLRNIVCNFRKGVHVNEPAKQAFPEDNREDDPYVRDPEVQCLRCQNGEVEHLQERRRVEPVHAEKRRR